MFAPQAGELSSRLALDHQPLDNWAHHALAHNFEESGRAGQGSAFLANTEEQWRQGENFSLHLHWHQALLHLQLGQAEEALSLYDDTIGPRASGGSPIFFIFYKFIFSLSRRRNFPAE